MSDCVICHEVTGDGAPLAYADELVAVYPAAFQSPGNPGCVLIATIAHLETLSDVADELCGPLLQRVRDIAHAVQVAAGATGTTIRQNNHPPGQDAPHLHFHIAPRFHGDDYWHATPMPVAWAVRVEQAARIASALS